MHKLRKILISGLAAFVLPQAAYGAQIDPVDILPTLIIESECIIPLESEFSILMDAHTGHIIHGVNMHDRAYPASMTKVMTALLLLESGHDFLTPILHSHDAISSVMPWHSGLADVDEFLTVDEALHAILLHSANDTSNAIAEFLGGSMDNFARMMTERAHQLGAVNTNFTNAHGLWEEEHYTTAYDMALIMREAIENELFRDIIATQSYLISPSENHEEFQPIYNSHNMIFPTSMHYSPDIVGGKTGFTNNSRHTLVSYGRRGDLELITVVMSVEQRGGIFADTALLMEYGFSQFLPHTIFSAHDFTRTIDLVQRSGEGVLVIGGIDIYPEDDVVLSLPMGFDTNSVTTEVYLPDRIIAPVAENFAVGRVLLEHNGNVLAEIALLTAQAGQPLSQDELAELFPGGGITRNAPDATDNDNLLTAGLILNTIIITAGVLTFAYVMLRFLQFSHRSRRKRPMSKYRGYRGYSGPYRASAHDYKFKYRYK